MIGKIIRHARGNAIAYLALFLALTAGAYAATKAPKNSVVSKSIQNGAVKTKKLANGAVTEGKTKTFAFTPVTLTGGWTTVAANPVPSYGKDTNGFVHLRGRMREGVLFSAPAFNLPSGFRPAETESFGVGVIFGGNSEGPCVVSVSTNGDVTVGVVPGDVNCHPAGSTLLYGITFRADGG